MSKLTPETIDQLKALKKQIEIDLAEINKGLGVASKAMDDSILSAWQVGNALIQAKALTGHGNFQTWWKATTGLSETTVFKYMKLAKSFPQKDLPANKRTAYQLMGIVPSKGQIQRPNNDETNPPLDGFLQIAGKWKSWMTDVEEKHLDYDHDEVKRHFKPMYDWLKGLYGE